MLIGHIDRADRHYLAGWAVDTDHPEAHVEVSVVVNDQQWKRVIADSPREDMKKHGSYGDGCHGFTYLFDRPMSVLESYRVEIVGRLHGTTKPLAATLVAKIPAIAQQKQPILITASGRSGTTVLMNHLRKSPTIVIADKYPFEMKLLTYYSKAFDLLTAPGNHTVSSQSDALNFDRDHLGSNPFNHHEFESILPDSSAVYSFFEKDVPPKLVQTFTSIISDFYNLLADRTGRFDCRYFAEKVDIRHATRNFSRIAFSGVKEIVLIRDPRDLFCSYRAFWQSRPDESIAALKDITDRILTLSRSLDSNRMIFVKYEDLVRRRDDTLHKISKFLELDDLLRADAAADRKLFQKHATSEDVAASVGRWRKELNAAETQLFADQFSEFLTAFDYTSRTAGITVRRRRAFQVG